MAVVYQTRGMCLQANMGKLKDKRQIKLKLSSFSITAKFLCEGYPVSGHIHISLFLKTNLLFFYQTNR